MDFGITYIQGVQDVRPIFLAIKASFRVACKKIFEKICHTVLMVYTDQHIEIFKLSSKPLKITIALFCLSVLWYLLGVN